jgi:hypothetical protein
MACVGAVAFWLPQVSFLWHNLIGAGCVDGVGNGMGTEFNVAFLCLRL